MPRWASVLFPACVGQAPRRSRPTLRVQTSSMRSQDPLWSAWSASASTSASPRASSYRLASRVSVTGDRWTTPTATTAATTTTSAYYRVPSASPCYAADAACARAPSRRVVDYLPPQASSSSSFASRLPPSPYPYSPSLGREASSSRRSRRRRHERAASSYETPATRVRWADGGGGGDDDDGGSSSYGHDHGRRHSRRHSRRDSDREPPSLRKPQKHVHWADETLAAALPTTTTRCSSRHRRHASHDAGGRSSGYGQGYGHGRGHNDGSGYGAGYSYSYGSGSYDDDAYTGYVAPRVVPASPRALAGARVYDYDHDYRDDERDRRARKQHRHTNTRSSWR